MNASHYSLGSRWLIPVSGPPVRDALVTISAGKIVAIQSGNRQQADVDLGDVALLPKFINAHTHLEFSSLPQPLGRPGNCITEWIPQVIQARRAMSAETMDRAILSGITQSLALGTIAIGEIASSDWFRRVKTVACRTTCFLERIGNRPEFATQLVDDAKAWIPESTSADYDFGISPHAPYSVHPELLSRLIQWACQARLPVAMHLAESQAELQWLRDGEGPFLNLLESLGALYQRPHGQTPLDYLRQLRRAPRALVIHGNYLDDREQQFLADNRERMTVVYCPRTHEYFGHQRYPLAELIDRRVRVAIGTDSRASNPDLSIWRELTCIRRRHPDVCPSEILRMGTQHAAHALPAAGRFGQLTVGGAAEILVLSNASIDVHQLLESLFDTADEPQPWNPLHRLATPDDA